jgi:hypothetical protein
MIENEVMNPDVSLYIEGNKLTPEIRFNEGVLSIIGRSILPDSKLSYDPLFKAFYLYSLNPKTKTEINIKLDYLNSDSNRSLMNILILAEKLHNHGNEVLIKWYYKNSDNFMFDQGRIFNSLIEVPFEFEVEN